MRMPILYPPPGGGFEVSLADAYRKERDVKVKERILIISLLAEGRSTYEAAGILHCPQSKVAYWKKRYEEEGLDGLKTRKQLGRPPKVAREKMKEVREVVEAGEWWTAKTVREMIHGEAGVLYTVRHVQRLLHTWGFSLIRPGKRHINKASREEVESFKKRPMKLSWKRGGKAGTWSARTSR